MKKREFIKTSAIITTGILINPFTACDSGKKKETENNKPEGKPDLSITSFELPQLAYGFDALEPHIDARTMEIHHGKHHKGYTKKFNKALDAAQITEKNLASILADIKDEDNDLNLRNNGGGYYNHDLFWKVIGPDMGGQPEGELANAINQTFGSFENFSNEFKNAAKTRFGSGWAWLIKNAEGKLQVTSTPNQDNPLMANIVENPGTPILGLDVWEHAYYLNYQNRRADYINAFFNLINWKQVAANLTAI